MQSWQELERFAKGVLKRFPKSKEAQQYLKIAKMKPKSKSELLALKKPETYGEWISLSLNYYYEGKYHEMIKACKQALVLNPKSHLAYNNLCSAYLEIEEWNKAIESCEKAVALKPDFEHAVNNLKLAREKL